MVDATPFLKLYSKFRNSQLDRLDPVQAQKRELAWILKAAENTRFGKEHSFSSITGPESFQKKVPLRNYEQFWTEYWEPNFPVLDNVTWPGRVKFFAVSSGTTSGTTKYIPYTKGVSRSYSKSGLDLLCHHLRNRPSSKIFSGKNFALGGSTELVERAPGVFSGDISGISVRELPLWAQPFFFPPERMALESDWEKKIDLFARESLKRRITTFGGVPSWSLIFIEKLRELTGKPNGKFVDFYPDLEMVVHGGVNFAPYKKQFDELLEGSHAELREVYPASEGFLAVSDRGFGEGLRLNLEHGIFYEFVPLEELDSENPTRHWIENVQEGVNYAVVLTTGAGIFSYVLGDTVRFVDTKVPRILITGRTSYSMSAFGEHLIAEEVEDAVSFAAESIQTEISDYCMGALFPEGDETLGGHLYLVEFSESQPSGDQLHKFEDLIDQRLSERNEDYEAHRAEGYGLRRPQVKVVRSGFFRDWMESRGKLGGQNKVPRMISDPELFTHVQEYLSRQ